MKHILRVRQRKVLVHSTNQIENQKRRKKYQEAIEKLRRKKAKRIQKAVAAHGERLQHIKKFKVLKKKTENELETKKRRQCIIRKEKQFVKHLIKKEEQILSKWMKHKKVASSHFGKVKLQKKARINEENQHIQKVVKRKQNKDLKKERKRASYNQKFHEKMQRTEEFLAQRMQSSMHEVSEEKEHIIKLRKELHKQLEIFFNFSNGSELILQVFGSADLENLNITDTREYLIKLKRIKQRLK